MAGITNIRFVEKSRNFISSIKDKIIIVIAGSVILFAIVFVISVVVGVILNIAVIPSLIYTSVASFTSGMFFTCLIISGIITFILSSILSILMWRIKLRRFRDIKSLSNYGNLWKLPKLQKILVWIKITMLLFILPLGWPILLFILIAVFMAFFGITLLLKGQELVGFLSITISAILFLITFISSQKVYVSAYFISSIERIETIRRE